MKLTKDLNSYIDSSSIYSNYITSSFNRYIKYSELPIKFLNDNINESRLPKKLKILYSNIYEIINNRYSYGILVSDYVDVCNLCSLLLKKYFNDSIQNDTLLLNVLYIDTPLLLDDYKKLIDKDDLTSDSITHTIETLQTHILTADMVFWDRFTLFSSNYDKQKIYNILSTRYRADLANIFFVKGGKDVLNGMIDEDFAQAMNIASFIDCMSEKVKYKQVKERTND